jgi:rRNA maturation endonuclease Nob1
MGHCDWNQDWAGNWETSCGNMFTFEVGSPTENHFSFCPYCGNPLVEHKYIEERIDES